MNKRIVALCILLAMLLGASALGEGYRLAVGNDMNFGMLLIDLLHAFETPSQEDEAHIASSLEAIRGISEDDFALASAVVEHWRAVYLDPDYPLYLYGGGEYAVELEQAAPEDLSAHAIVVLGYELKNGEMAGELKKRCDAAAALAHSWPGAILVCSGGATGENNPHDHTEAGLMRDYLVAKGIDASRIFIDEQARNTVQNAVNTFRILMERGIRTYTIVTSSYHQQWGQVIYNAMGEICRQMTGYSAAIVANYSCDITPGEYYAHGDRWAVRQLASVLGLSDEVIEAMKQAF